MATIYGLKPRFQALLRPFTNRLASSGVTANQVTLAAAVLSVAYGALIALSHGAPLVLVGLPAVLLVRMGMNAIDGLLAREHHQESRLGFFLNEIGDVVSDAALYLPLALAIAPAYPLVAGSMAVAISLTECAGVLSLAAGGSRRYDGPFGKSDRAAYFSIVAVIAALVAMPRWVAAAMLGAALVLALVTVVNRVRTALVAERVDG
jgi:phosphatidylglycerophosphate synthase